MFKLFTKLMMLLVVFALAGPFILKRPDGQPLMSARDLQLPAFPTSIDGLWQSLRGLFADKAAPASHSVAGAPAGASISWSKQPIPSGSFVPQAGVEYPKQEGVFYRYKDASGIWQFADTPQPGTTNYVSNVDTNANVIQSLNKDQIDAALGRTPPPPPPDQAKEEKKDDSLLSKIPLPTTVPAAEIPNLIQQAKDVQKLVNERTQQLENSKM